jgi:hypothetical protein
MDTKNANAPGYTPSPKQQELDKTTEEVLIVDFTPATRQGNLVGTFDVLTGVGIRVQRAGVFQNAETKEYFVSGPSFPLPASGRREAISNYKPVLLSEKLKTRLLKAVMPHVEKALEEREASKISA